MDVTEYDVRNLALDSAKVYRYVMDSYDAQSAELVKYQIDEQLKQSRHIIVMCPVGEEDGEPVRRSMLLKVDTDDEFRAWLRAMQNVAQRRMSTADVSRAL